MERLMLQRCYGLLLLGDETIGGVALIYNCKRICREDRWGRQRWAVMALDEFCEGEALDPRSAHLASGLGLVLFLRFGF